MTLMHDTAHAKAKAERDAHRARYDELRAAGQGAAKQALPPATDRSQPLPAGSLLHHEQVPGGWYHATRLPRGEALRIVNTTGTSTVSLVAWSVADTSERLHLVDTMKIQWSISICKGRILYTDMGRVALSVIEDSSGAHDAVVGPTTLASMQKALGPGSWRNSRDNFLAATAKLGLSRRDLHPCMNFFAPVGVDEEGRFLWQDGKRTAGDFVDLRAEMDLWVIVSNAGHPLDPALTATPGAIDVMRFAVPPADANDICRTSGPEAARAFEITERHLHQVSRANKEHAA
jgi:urea carboxylase-associated protein 2